MFDVKLQKLGLENKVIDLKKVIEEKENLLSSKTEYLRKLQDNLKQVHAKMEGLRDPDGMRNFRKLLNVFDRDIDYITAEKDAQYTAMKNVVAMMDKMGKEKAI